MAEAETQKAAPVVKPVQAKKFKIDGKKVAYYNAFALSFAAFFGVALIFNAIAGFTRNADNPWSFGIPFAGIFLSWNISGVPSVFLLALIALVLSIFGLVTVSKITDADALKKAWCATSKVFFVLSSLFGIAMFAVCVYALMIIQKNIGTVEKELWLEGFIPTMIMFATSLGIFFIAKAIANGKTQLVRVMSYIALSVASIALIMVFVDRMIYIHGKNSSFKYLLD